MRRASLLIGIMGLSLAALATVSGARPASRACPPASAHVLLSDREARIYLFNDPKDYEFPAVGACTIGHQPLQLNREDVIAEVEPERESVRSDWRHTFALAGTTFAYAADRPCEDKYIPCDQSEWFIVVRNLRTGRFIHRRPSAPHRRKQPWDHYVGVGPASQVVVKRDAGVGWIVPNEVLRKELRLEHEEHGEHVASYATEEPLTYEVYADDRNGLRRLASGQDVVPASLTISGNTISWTQGGKRFSAPLL